MNNEHYGRSIFNFPLTLENYDRIADYVEKNQLLNENNAEVFNLYESIIFELAVYEIGVLRNHLKTLYDKYIELHNVAQHNSNVANELMSEFLKLADAEKQRQQELENNKKPPKKKSFIEKLKDKFLDS